MCSVYIGYAVDADILANVSKQFAINANYYYNIYKSKIMNIRYFTEPETGLPHIYNHDISEDEVEDILLNPGEDWRRQRRKGIR